MLKTRYKVALGAVAVIALLGLGKCAFDSGIIPKPKGMVAAVPEGVEIPKGDVVQGAPRYSYDLPTQPVGNFQGCAKLLSIPWNATSSLTLANGGPRTTGNSLVKQYSGGCLEIERQDDYSVMRSQMLAFAQARKNGDANPQTGAAFAIIMGDALPSFAAALQPQMRKLDQDAVVVTLAGFSYGEDKCMGKPLNGSPQNARGSLIAAVPADGDQNICIKWAADNGIPINVNQQSYDPQAINFLDVTSFTEANDRYIGGYCEDRSVSEGGKLTGKKQRVCVNGVATWTPGDVTVAKQKGGVVSWASTREYSQQMAAVLIVNKQWAEQNRAFVVGLLRAIDRGSFAIRTGNGLGAAAEANANIFGSGGGDEGDPAYWARYFVGEDFTDSQGNKVRLGGSRVATLAEVRDYFGLGQGTLNAYKAVYNTFGKVYTTFYSRDIPTFPDYATVVDTSFVQAALQGVNVGSTAQTYKQGAITETVSQKAYAIEFDTGRATIRPSSMNTIFEIAEQAGVTGLRIRVDGHTDATGDPSANMSLSRQRAQAVANALHEVAPATFPKERIAVRGYGDTNPKCTRDNSASCLQENRRVEIVLGQ